MIFGSQGEELTAPSPTWDDQDIQTVEGSGGDLRGRHRLHLHGRVDLDGFDSLPNAGLGPSVPVEDADPDPLFREEKEASPQEKSHHQKSRFPSHRSVALLPSVFPRKG